MSADLRLRDPFIVCVTPRVNEYICWELIINRFPSESAWAFVQETSKIYSFIERFWPQNFQTQAIQETVSPGCTTWWFCLKWHRWGGTIYSQCLFAGSGLFWKLSSQSPRSAFGSISKGKTIICFFFWLLCTLSMNKILYSSIHHSTRYIKCIFYGKENAVARPEICLDPTSCPNDIYSKTNITHCSKTFRLIALNNGLIRRRLAYSFLWGNWCKYWTEIQTDLCAIQLICSLKWFIMAIEQHSLCEVSYFIGNLKYSQCPVSHSTVSRLLVILLRHFQKQLMNLIVAKRMVWISSRAREAACQWPRGFPASSTTFNTLSADAITVNNKKSNNHLTAFWQNEFIYPCIPFVS